MYISGKLQVVEVVVYLSCWESIRLQSSVNVCRLYACRCIQLHKFIERWIENQSNPQFTSQPTIPARQWLQILNTENQSEDCSVSAAPFWRSRWRKEAPLRSHDREIEWEDRDFLLTSKNISVSEPCSLPGRMLAMISKSRNFLPATTKTFWYNMHKRRAETTTYR